MRPLRESVAGLLVMANLLVWILLLVSREPTPWHVLEARRPLVTSTSVELTLVSTDGLPLFGREFSGCGREWLLTKLFRSVLYLL